MKNSQNNILLATVHFSRRLLSVKWLWASARLTNEDRRVIFNRKIGGYSKIIIFTSDDSWEGVIYVHFYCFIELTIRKSFYDMILDVLDDMDLSFLIHLTTRSTTLNPFPPLRKYWRLNY